MMIIFENDDIVVESASYCHPGFDSAIDLAKKSGDVIVGHVVHRNAATGCDTFGRSPLAIVAILPDDTVATLYEFGWRWSGIGGRNILGWWYGPSEWDISAIQEYGPVLERSLSAG
jgi:hypothetical protein